MLNDIMYQLRGMVFHSLIKYTLNILFDWSPQFVDLQDFKQSKPSVN